MADTKPVIVGVDDADGQDVLGRYAAHEAVMRAVPLHVAHTVASPLPFDGAEEARSVVRQGAAVVDRLEAVARSAFPGLTVAGELPSGDPASTLVERSADASSCWAIGAEAAFHVWPSAGNRPLPDHGELDRACRRSADAYPHVLGRTNDWRVLNLACSGATIRDGVLGVQILGEQVAPPQFAQAQRATEAVAVLVGVGANDVRWSELVKLCAVSPSCDDRASTAFFQNHLARFALTTAVCCAAWPPFGSTRRCSSTSTTTVRPGRRLPSGRRSHPAEDAGPALSTGRPQQRSAAGRRDRRLHDGQAGLRGPRPVQRPALRAGPGGPRPPASDGRRSPGHRPGRPAGPQSGRALSISSGHPGHRRLWHGNGTVIRAAGCCG